MIASPDGEVAVAPFENPALASGGTGDVLSGTIGSLLAQGLTPFAAARLGVYLHGLAGRPSGIRLGDAGLLASDLPDEIALARRRLAALAPRATAAPRRLRESRGPRRRRPDRRRGERRRRPRPRVGGTAGAAAYGVARVDLDRLAENLAASARAVPTGVSVEPVVKADAYGHGAVPVARALESCRRRRPGRRDVG